MIAALVLGLLASVDERSIVSRMYQARSTVPLLSNPPRSVTVGPLSASPAPAQSAKRSSGWFGKPEKVVENKLSWSSLRVGWRHDIGGVQTGVIIDQSQHADYFETASIAKRVIDSDVQLDAQITHTFASKCTKLAASVLTKHDVRISSEIDTHFSRFCVGVSKNFNDLPASRYLGEQLSISPTVNFGARELTLEVAQDIGTHHVFAPWATIKLFGQVQKWGVGWMTKLNNGDALCAQVDPATARVDVRYDRVCCDGSLWRIKMNVPSVTSGLRCFSAATCSVTRTWDM
jgi:hypothetical protein